MQAAAPQMRGSIWSTVCEFDSTFLLTLTDTIVCQMQHMLLMQAYFSLRKKDYSRISVQWHVCKRDEIFGMGGRRLVGISLLHVLIGISLLHVLIVRVGHW